MKTEKNKFISKYVEGLHNKIYTEAERLYNEIKEKNPDRRDMTKTVEFMRAVEPHKTIPVYYYMKWMEQQEYSTKNSTTTTTTNDGKHMVLNIPLMPLTEIARTTEDLETAEPLPIINQQDPEMPEPLPIINQQDPTTTTQDPEIQHLEIPLEAYEEALYELRQDPDLFNIFDDFNTTIQENVEIYDEANNDMWDVHTIETETLLERELRQNGY